MKILFDLDGVIRSLYKYYTGYEPSSWYESIDGMSLIDVVNKDKIGLMKAEPTEYYSVIKEYSDKLSNSHSCWPIIITAQPESWRPATGLWINKHLPNAFTVYVDSANEKIDYVLNSYDTVIVEDYPMFGRGFYRNVVLIDRPYNRCVNNQLCRINSPEELNTVIEKLL